MQYAESLVILEKLNLHILMEQYVLCIHMSLKKCCISFAYFFSTCCSMSFVIYKYSCPTQMTYEHEPYSLKIKRILHNWNRYFSSFG